MRLHSGARKVTFHHPAVHSIRRGSVVIVLIVAVRKINTRAHTFGGQIISTKLE